MLSPDGVRRLYTFDSVEGTPVVVAVALAVDEVLQPWVRRAMLIVPVTIALSAAMLALMLLYRRKWRGAARSSASWRRRRIPTA